MAEAISHGQRSYSQLRDLESLGSDNKASLLASSLCPITRYARLALNEVGSMLVRPGLSGDVGVVAH